MNVIESGLLKNKGIMFMPLSQDSFEAESGCHIKKRAWQDLVFKDVSSSFSSDTR